MMDHKVKYILPPSFRLNSPTLKLQEFGQVLAALPLDGKSAAHTLRGANVSSGPLCYDATTSTLLVRRFA
jgi:hypothetical protein